MTPCDGCGLPATLTADDQHACDRCSTELDLAWEPIPSPDDIAGEAGALSMRCRSAIDPTVRERRIRKPRPCAVCKRLMPEDWVYVELKAGRGPKKRMSWSFCSDACTPVQFHPIHRLPEDRAWKALRALVLRAASPAEVPASLLARFAPLPF